MIDFDLMGWRDIVLVVAAAISVYLVLMVMRLFRVKGKRRGEARQAGKASFSGWQPYSSDQGLAAQAVPDESAPKFAEELERSSVEAELDRLRRESAQQRDELARLGEEILRLKAARNISPLYNEAMTLAQQGMNADGIAGHCGISIGEAELVAALARSKDEFGRDEQGEDCDERHTGSGNRIRG